MNGDGSDPAIRTPDRLLDAAERIIAARGVDGASLRTINAAAGANVAAVHYHFGSKEQLVRAVLARRVRTEGEFRLALLAELESEPSPMPRQIATALALPLTRVAGTAGGPDYIGFLDALDAAGEPWWSIVEEAFAPEWNLLGNVYERCAPGLSPLQRSLRMSTAMHAQLRLLGSRSRHFGPLPLDLVYPELVDVLTAILTPAGAVTR